MQVQPQDLYKLTEEDWIEIYNRLRLFVRQKYGHMRMLKGRIDFDEVIQDAITDTLRGIRRWPPVDAHGGIKNISFFCFLCHTVRSKVSHILEQQKKAVRLDGISDELQELGIRMNNVIASSLQRSDQQAQYNEVCRFVINASYNHKTQTDIAKLLVDTPDLRPKDIAELLNLSEPEVRNHIKCLSRKVKKVLEERTRNVQLELRHSYASKIQRLQAGGVSG